MKKLLLFLLLTLQITASETFVLLDSQERTLAATGPDLHRRFPPCSTFKITLSLIGFDAGILTDEATPLWHPSKPQPHPWNTRQTPLSWIQTSCLWYSKKLAAQLGPAAIQHYLHQMSYGNEDVSGGLPQFWINSSLKISPYEQTYFIKRLVSNQLPLSPNAILFTKKLLFREILPEGGRLYGKTGWSGPTTPEIGWFVGWVEREDLFFPFAYLVTHQGVSTAERIEKTKQLLRKSGI